MAEFTGEDLHSLILEPSCSAVKSNMQLIDDLISHRFMEDLSSDDHQQPQFSSVNFVTNDDIQTPALNLGGPGLPVLQSLTTPFFCSELEVDQLKHENKKEKGSGGRKRKRDNETEEITEKPSEVIHVRVKRGQATDSHSLAERVRRQKINERLKSLQNLVPGCYKTMGMAVMLDVIIQYIQSLQNQIEFLSMKLSAANSFCEFNSLEINNAMETVVQQGNNVCEGSEMERMATEEGYGGLSYVQPTWPF